MTGLDASMFELFRAEVKAHADTLSAGLLAAEADPNPSRLEPLMRAAHSIKGAARIMGIDTAVQLAHAMEDAIVSAQQGQIRLKPTDIDTLLKGADILASLADISQDTVEAWVSAHAPRVTELEPLLLALAGKPTVAPAVSTPLIVETVSPNGPVVAFDPTGFPTLPPFAPVEIPAEPFELPAVHTMLNLFREETRGHLYAITNALSALVNDPTATEPIIESFKQIRGAARLVKCSPIADAAAALSDFVSTVRERKSEFSPLALDWLRLGVFTLAGSLTTTDETFPMWLSSATEQLTHITEAMTGAAKEVKGSELAPIPNRATESPLAVPTASVPDLPPSFRKELPAPSTSVSVAIAPSTTPALAQGSVAEPVVRVTAQSLNRLMGLAGESLVQARWLPSFSTALLKLKKQHDRLAVLLDTAYHAAVGGVGGDYLGSLIVDARRQWAACRLELNEKTTDFDDHAARAEDLNARLYREVIASRMRPFGDGVHGLPRLVRDMARSLGKEARLVVAGENTEVDRDILEKLESPLSHLVRNSLDHGLESPDVRTVAGKPTMGVITVEARHRAGVLQVSVSDDGSGVNLARLRQKIVDRGLNTGEMVARMSDAELLEFLFLPGFSTATTVTEFSGRGVGLDVVQDTVRKVGGSVRVTTVAGRGTTFHLQLPLTLSVIRAVVVNVGGEPYAFPHTRIDRLLRVPRREVRSLEHRQFVSVDGQNVGLVMAGQLLDVPAPTPEGAELPVVLFSDISGAYGLVVDSFRGEQDLVVRPLDSRLGKVPNLSAAAILDDGSPVLIVDVEDLIRSMDQFIQTGVLARCEAKPAGPVHKKRVLVVDDSITVREVERQLLLHRGYEVTVAVDGMDGWNKVRADRFDLMVSDVDMPRMTGLQLVQAVRGDDRLKDLPVIIVSYKEREEDRLRGLEVGANSYLTKSSFHDNRFIEAVMDLIGEP
ncbi:MAG: hybrid sensor histidine kinase/response regulator [Planctomycetia bacterium]|nr:hybrid sensor histidine kinase/response regulator [Planctomycetia bacterium]